MKSRNSLRVHVGIWMDDKLRKELLERLVEFRGAIDEVAFFTSRTHPPLPRKVILERAAVLTRVIPEFKAIGLSAGINHLATLGHLDENLDFSLREPWQHLVDMTGTKSPSCYCAADPSVMTYIKDCYEALAKAKPDFIWVDDDVRMEGHGSPIGLSCFCKHCMTDFSTETGHTRTREELHDAFQKGSIDERLRLRKAWLEHCRTYIANLLAAVRSAVDNVDPKIELGMMTGEIEASGYGFARWAEVMAGSRGIDVKWRPGGGFYTDETPLSLLTKAHSTGRQAGFLPAAVKDIQYELENFPYQYLRKSVTAFNAEVASAMAAGCTGVALNILDITATTLSEAIPYLAATRDRRKFLDRLAGTFGRRPCEGVWQILTKDHFAAENVDGDWRHANSWGSSLHRVGEIAEIGIPMAYQREGAVVNIISGDQCLAFSRPELENFLSGAVLMDGQALVRLNELGLGELTGFSVREKLEKDTIEKFTNDPINEGFAGEERDCRPSFWQETAFLLKPAAAAGRILSDIVDFGPRSHGPTSGVFENKLGGRVAVLGYYPWRMIQTRAKVIQMRRLVRWLSRDKLPAYVDSWHKAVVWHRRDAQGRRALLVLNTSLDPTEGIRVRVLGKQESPMMARAEARGSKVDITDFDGVYSTVVLPPLSPWEPVLVAFGSNAD